jgi:hypothetical protein
VMRFDRLNPRSTAPRNDVRKSGAGSMKITSRISQEVLFEGTWR